MVVQQALEQRCVARRRLEYRLDLGIRLLRRGVRLVQEGRHCKLMEFRETLG